MPYTNVAFNPQFWKTLVQKTKFSTEDIPDLTGKVAIVTGANSGLGYATTVALASHGAHVFLACRSKDKALEAIERAKVEIRGSSRSASFPTSTTTTTSTTTNSAPSSPTGKAPTAAAIAAAKYLKDKDGNAVEPKLEFLQLDLNDMNSCSRAAKEFLEKGLALHILINNGGIMTSPFALSADGIEQQFAVNHMGHFVFTMGLLDKIIASQPSRIVMLSSIGHEHTPKHGIDFETLNDRSASNPASRYGRSKLANILFGKALARRLAKEKVWVNMPHPGFVYTELARNNKDSMGVVAAGVYDLAGRMCASKPEVGCLNQLWLATSEEVVERNLRGLYFVPVGNELRPSSYALDEELQEKLWTFSEQLMHEKVKEA
ncbi:hypothetical protein BKA57DRAFT_471174 [Linnemannia elongata]|nr:hypothetical protein BKA57DRAFT_471174 [Linnemannia elongata]